MPHTHAQNTRPAPAQPASRHGATVGPGDSSDSGSDFAAADLAFLNAAVARAGGGIDCDGGGIAAREPASRGTVDPDVPARPALPGPPPGGHEPKGPGPLPGSPTPEPEDGAAGDPRHRKPGRD